ncbi:MAG: CRISPR-associated endonuclease Cas1 [Caldimicrobium sp.]|nr:CRISPR-associated endonuclease Cas1 [Caldimicrobium sp.]
MKRTLVLFSEYVELSKKNDRLHVGTLRGETSLPVINLDGILIYGKAKLTSEVIEVCAKGNIPILLLTHYGRIKGLILPPLSSEGLMRRLKQAKLYFAHRFVLAKYIVKRKLLEIEYVFDKNLEDLKLRVERVQDYDSLFGIEGAGSREMFKVFAEEAKRQGFDFEERTYNPPLNEANALLSFIYTLGYNLAISLIYTKGFDPYISYLHSKRGDHAAFASDLLEIIRPHLTSFALELLSSKVITKRDFYESRRAYYLNREGARKILEALVSKKEDLLSLLKEFLIELENFEALLPEREIPS